MLTHVFIFFWNVLEYKYGAIKIRSEHASLKEAPPKASPIANLAAIVVSDSTCVRSGRIVGFWRHQSKQRGESLGKYIGNTDDNTQSGQQHYHHRCFILHDQRSLRVIPQAACVDSKTPIDLPHFILAGARPGRQTCVTYDIRKKLSYGSFFHNKKDKSASKEMRNQ